MATDNAAPLLEEATAQLGQIRPRKTVEPGTTDATDLDAETAWWPVDGTATFRTTSDGVDVTVVIGGCRKPYAYPVVLYAGSDCSAVRRDSEPWDGTRGVLPSKAFCFGVPARAFASRASTEDKPWTIGGPASSNLLGRTLAILDPDTQEPLACGTIQAAEGALPANTRELPELRPDVVAQLSGLCQLGPVLPADTAAPGVCPDLNALAPCGLEHCVAGCLDRCGDYVACLQARAETCTVDCQPEPECASCLGAATQCMFGYCRAEVSCAPAPTPGGPCTELRTCCTRQGPLVESCNEYATLMEQLGGDASCNGALYDWDVNEHYTYRSPCYPDGGAPMP